MRHLLLVLFALSIAGCEDDVDATVDLGRPFTLYGYLDPTADRQTVRVVPITDRIDADGAVEAEVTSTDLGSGVVTAWRDSAVTFADGTAGTVFLADVTPAPDSRVRFEARAPNGDVSRVTVTVPPLVEAEVGPSSATLLDVTFPVRFEGAPRVLTGALRLVVTGLAADEETTLTVPTNDRPRLGPDGAWRVDVSFVSSVRRFFEAEGLLGASLELVRAEYAGFVADADWVPPTTDPDALAEPGTFSNVEGGFGRLGAGYFAVARWVPPAAVQASAGFRNVEAARAVRLNEVRTGAAGWVEIYNPSLAPVNLGGYTLSDDQLAPGKQELDVVVPSGGFAVVPLAFPLGAPSEIGLFNRAGLQVQRRVFSDVSSGRTVGSFPDGLSFQLPQNGPDIFQSALRPTPGRPNELAVRPGFINEVFTEGSAGFVEVVAADGFGEATFSVFGGEDGYFDAVRADGGTFLVAPETSGRLELPQQGAALFLVSRFPEFLDGEPTLRVVDARTYGGQAPGQSSGYVPDAPAGAWTRGRRPTRGAPNESGRRSL